MCDVGAGWGVKEEGGGCSPVGRVDGIEMRLCLDDDDDDDAGGCGDDADETRDGVSTEADRVAPRVCVCPCLYTYLLLGTWGRIDMCDDVDSCFDVGDDDVALALALVLVFVCSEASRCSASGPTSRTLGLRARMVQDKSRVKNE